MADTHIGKGKTIGLNTEDKRRMLRRAWDAAGDEANTLLDSIKNLQAQCQQRLDENLSSSSANSHSSSSNQPSTNAPTDTEEMRAWNDLIERFQVTGQFLRRCAKYGLDAFQVFCLGYFPTLPAPVNPSVTVDLTGKWGDKADLNGIDAAKIVGAPVGDEAIYVWMLDKLVAVTQSRGDYSMGIIGRGGMQFT